MDAGYARPAGGTSGPAVRSEVTPPRTGVKPELSPSKAVGEVQASEAAADAFGSGGEAGREALARTALRLFVERRTTLDAASRTLVTQMVLATGEVVGQFPDQGTMKLRAYMRELAEADRRPVFGDRRVGAVA